MGADCRKLAAPAYRALPRMVSSMCFTTIDSGDATMPIDLHVPAAVRHSRLIAWVAEMAALCQPARIHWCDGSQEEYEALCQQLVDAGTFTKCAKSLGVQAEDG